MTPRLNSTQTTSPEERKLRGPPRICICKLTLKFSSIQSAIVCYSGESLSFTSWSQTAAWKGLACWQQLAAPVLAVAWHCVNMITFTFCGKTLLGYVLHCRVHRNKPSLFKFLGTEWTQTFYSYSAFKTHFYWVHSAESHPESVKAVVRNLKCAISLCGLQTQTVRELVAHLNEHIKEGQPIACVVTRCKQVFLSRILTVCTRKMHVTFLLKQETTALLWAQMIH